VSLAIILYAFPFLNTDSVPPMLLDSPDMTAGSAEIFYCNESPVFEDTHYSLLLSGGPLIYSDSFREMCYWGGGGELELRRYKTDDLAGFFLGGFSNAKAMWKVNSDRREAVTIGLKFGWKKDFHKFGLPFDVEPYCYPAIIVHNDSDDDRGFMPHFCFGFGMRIPVF